VYGRPGIIYGFHGCDRRIGEEVLASHSHHLKRSQNEYDWLGNGIYFWESSPERALDFAREAKRNAKITRGTIRHPYVIGAVIELGNCLNLLDHAGLMEMQFAHKTLVELSEQRGEKLPANAARDPSNAYLLRFLDCAVLETLHTYRQQAGLPAYDTVVGAMWEGCELYKGAGLFDKNHVQICVRNSDCIKAYFRVREIEGTDLFRWDTHPLQPSIPSSFPDRTALAPSRKRPGTHRK
jgi:hypothetical protein